MGQNICRLCFREIQVDEDVRRIFLREDGKFRLVLLHTTCDKTGTYDRAVSILAESLSPAADTSIEQFNDMLETGQYDKIMMKNSTNSELLDIAKRLRATLTGEQAALLAQLEEAYRLKGIKDTRFFYSSGFCNAIIKAFEEGI